MVTVVLVSLVLANIIFAVSVFKKFQKPERVKVLPDTVYIERTEYIPKPTKVFSPVCVPMVVDTAAIIADYLSTVFYDDTLIHTPDLTVTVRDSVSKNRIISRDFDISLRPLKGSRKQPI